METETYKKYKNAPKNNEVEFLVVHHSAASENQSVKSIEDYHLSLGWSGIGYHYLITKTGELWKGRPEHVNGAHVKEDNINYRSLGICVIGDFAKKLPTPEQVSALKTLLEDLKARYNVSLEKIVPHRHFLGKPPYKDCFGSNLKDDWARNLITPQITPKSIILKRIDELKQLVEQL